MERGILRSRINGVTKTYQISEPFEPEVLTADEFATKYPNELIELQKCGLKKCNLCDKLTFTVRNN